MSLASLRLHDIPVEPPGGVELLPLDDRETHRLADGDDVLHEPGRELVDLAAVPGRQEQHLAVGVGVLGEPLGLLDVAAAADDPVVGHEDDIRLLRGLGHARGDVVSPGRRVRGERDLREEDVGLGVDAVRRHEPGEEECVAVRRVAVHARVHPRRAHHRDVHLDLARARAVAAELAGRHVDEADVLPLHEALAAQGRRTQHEVFADAHREVAPVSVSISSVVDAPPHLADLVLHGVDRGGVEEPVELAARPGLGAALPVVSRIIPKQFCSTAT